jgi:lycopene beta-cyclase
MLVNGIAAGVLVQVLVVFLILVSEWGWKQTVLTCLGLVFCAWLAEWIGSSTGLFFGSYHYTSLLQPQLLGVPLIIPLAWLMMLPPSWAIASAILGLPSRLTGLRQRFLFALLSALAFTAWDLFLDPQMVRWGLWIWETPGSQSILRASYFGIPWQNYLGWFLVSGLITFLFGRIDLPVGPLMIVYLITWILQTIGQFFFWGLPGPALFGFLGMGFMAGWAIRKVSSFKLREQKAFD